MQHFEFVFHCGKKYETDLRFFPLVSLEIVSIPNPSLMHDLSCLINNSKYSDVTFLIEGKEVHANRAILSVRSEYFKVMLYSGGMRESIIDRDEGGKCSNEPIELSDVSYEVFLQILHYLYTDTINEIELEIGLPLLMASERFMLDRLKSLCEEQISRYISSQNVIPIYIASYR